MSLDLRANGFKLHAENARFHPILATYVGPLATTN